MKKIIIFIIAVLFMATAVQAAEPYEPYGGKFNYMTFSLGRFNPISASVQPSTTIF